MTIISIDRSTSAVLGEFNVVEKENGLEETFRYTSLIMDAAVIFERKDVK